MPKTIKMVQAMTKKGEGLHQAGPYQAHLTKTHAKLIHYGTTTVDIDLTTGIASTAGWSRTDLDSIYTFLNEYGYCYPARMIDIGKTYNKEGEVDVP